MGDLWTRGLLPAVAACTLFLGVLTGPVYAAESRIILYINENSIWPATPPLLANGTVYLPLRETAGLLGYRVEWEAATGTVLVMRGDWRLRLRPGSAAVEAGGQPAAMTVPAMVVNGVVVAPLEFFGLGLGATVGVTRDESWIVVQISPAPPDWTPAWYGDLVTGGQGPAGAGIGLGPAGTPGGQRVVYLTFDDGPDPYVTPLVLDTLKAAGIRATFFVVGASARRYPDLVRRIAREGHVLGSHSWDHNYAAVYGSPQALLGSLNRTRQVIRDLTGVDTVLWRAPGGTPGHMTPAMWEAVGGAGYVEFDWTASVADATWPRLSSAEILGNVHAYCDPLLGRPIILLMHDGYRHEQTAAALGNIIAYFRAQGYTFGVLTADHPAGRRGP